MDENIMFHPYFHVSYILKRTHDQPFLFSFGVWFLVLGLKFIMVTHPYSAKNKGPLVSIIMVRMVTPFT